MIDHRVSCIAKNYKLDTQTKAALQYMDKKTIMEIEAPTDAAQEPVFMAIKDP